MKINLLVFLALVSAVGCKARTEKRSSVKADSAEPVSTGSMSRQDFRSALRAGETAVGVSFSCSSETAAGGDAAIAQASSRLPALHTAVSDIVSTRNSRNPRQLRIAVTDSDSIGLLSTNPFTWVINISCGPRTETAETIANKFLLLRLFAQHAPGNPDRNAVILNPPFRLLDTSFLQADFDMFPLTQLSTWTRISESVHQLDTNSKRQSSFALSATTASQKVPVEGGWAVTIDVRTIRSGSLGDLGAFLDNPTTFPPAQPGSTSSQPSSATPAKSTDVETAPEAVDDTF